MINENKLIMQPTQHNEIKDFSKLAKLLHWLIALLVIVMLFSFFLDDLPKPDRPFAFLIHKSFGLTILTLMVVRIIWIFYKGRPELPALMPSWEKFLSKFVQYSLYCFLILMPLSGWVMSVAADRTPSYFGLFNVPLPGISPDKSLSEMANQIHTIIAWIIIVLLCLHVLGALKHYFIDKDEVLQRMM